MKKTINYLILTTGILIITEKSVASDLCEVQGQDSRLTSSSQVNPTAEPDIDSLQLKHAVNQQILTALKESRNIAAQAYNGCVSHYERALLNQLYQGFLITIEHICRDFKIGAGEFDLSSLGLACTDIFSLESAGESLLKLDTAINIIARGNANPFSVSDKLEVEIPILASGEFRNEVIRVIWLINETNKNVKLINDFLSKSLTLSAKAGAGDIDATERAVLNAYHDKYKANIDNICAQFRFDGEAILNTLPDYVLPFNGRHLCFAALTTAALGIENTNVLLSSDAISAIATLSNAQRTVNSVLISNEALLSRLSIYKNLADLGFVPN